MGLDHAWGENVIHEWYALRAVDTAKSTCSLSPLIVVQSTWPEKRKHVMIDGNEDGVKEIMRYHYWERNHIQNKWKYSIKTITDVTSVWPDATYLKHETKLYSRQRCMEENYNTACIAPEELSVAIQINVLELFYRHRFQLDRYPPVAGFFTS